MSWEKVSITDLEAQVSPEILNRGHEYLKSGHILRACRFDQVIAGEVAGTGGYYRVRLSVDETKIYGVCNCPYPNFCKHMAALALAWIEKSADFIDLKLDFNELINDPKKHLDLLVRLIRSDPLNYLDLHSPNLPEKLFLNSRGVLNLIRNTFQGQIYTHEQMEALWERIEGIKDLVAKAMANHDKEAPELLVELLRGVANSYKDYRSIQLKNNFNELILLSKGLKQGWTRKEILPYLETIWEIYSDNNLWELAEEIRPVIVEFHPECSHWLAAHLEAVDWNCLDQTKLIAYYELLVLISEKGPVEAKYFQKALQVLEETTEGKLWLIDRTMDADPDWAYALAKEGIRSNNQDDKPFFRERLIEIHLRRNENKQAAALSFIQFQERPSLEEYLRLKTILAGRRELQDYIKRIEKITEATACVSLAARIAFDRKDWVNLETKIRQLDPAEAILKELAELIIVNNKRMPAGIFEALVTRLLQGSRNNWEITLGLLINYKKFCLKNAKNDEWDRFRSALSAEYGEDRRFMRKFGAVLAG